MDKAAQFHNTHRPLPKLHSSKSAFSLENKMPRHHQAIFLFLTAISLRDLVGLFPELAESVELLDFLSKLLIHAAIVRLIT